MAKRIIALLMMSGLSFSVSAGTLEGVMLKYMESEQGLEPFASRTIVTKQYVRMDDGEDDGDYLIFDRTNNLISSVTHEDETVLELPLQEVTQPSPMALTRRQTLEADTEAPLVSGKQPQQLQLFVNDKPCYNAMVVPGLAEDTVQALRRFKRILAGEQGKMLSELPAEMLEACDLALHTYHPEWSLESGLPIQEWDNALQHGRVLVEIDQEFKAEDTLFALPAAYRRYRMP